MIGSGWQRLSPSPNGCHKEDKKTPKPLGLFSLVDHVAVSSVYSILILNTLIKPLIKYQSEKGNGEVKRERNLKIIIKYWDTFQLNQTLLSHFSFLK